MKAFGIFEGGGAKGLAHVGALSAAQRRDIEFIGVAGASAGAIVAALVACGYSAEDLFNAKNPDDQKKIYSVNPLSFFEERWPAFSKALKALDALTTSHNTLVAYFRLGLFGLRHRVIIAQLRRNLGVFDTTPLEVYIDQKLEEKLLQIDPTLLDRFNIFLEPRTCQTVRVCFKHIEKMPLKIVATDNTRGQLLVFSKDESPDYEVASAVVASICLPFVFKPKLIDLKRLKLTTQQDVLSVQAIDGGLLSNFPAWLFDAERLDAGPRTPTFGFRLVEKKQSGTGDDTRSPLTGFLKRLVRTILDGDPLLETREIENLHEIPLSVTVGTLDFSMNGDRKKKLFDEGYNSAAAHFDKPGLPREPQIISAALGLLLTSFRELFFIDKSVTIRANIICQTTRGTLRVTYSFGMDTDSDTDDELEFRLGGGACSKCWNEKTPVICDLEEASKDFKSLWSMTKYQQALVRRDLRSLLCYPIIARSDVGLESMSPTILGVLNIDSPSSELLEVFSSKGSDDFFQQAMPKIARLMMPAFAADSSLLTSEGKYE